MSDMPTFLCIFGTRPEAVKLLPVVRAMRARGAHVTVVYTAQHATLASEVFDAFGIRPDVVLPSRTARALVPTLCDMLRSLDAYLCDVTRTHGAPHAVIVQGDTLSAYAAGLCAFLSRVPVVHVEAGLRTGVFDTPFPEEMLRRSLSAMATLHAAPSGFAAQHLLCEGVRPQAIVHTGNTVADALALLLEDIEKDTKREPTLPPVRDAELTSDGATVPKGKSVVRRILLTLHRREMSSEARRALLCAIAEEMQTVVGWELLYPVHPDPTVRRDAQHALEGVPHVRLCEPLGLRDFYRELRRCTLVLTDSGGVCEESVLLGHTPLILRDVTEREEELVHGQLTLVGTDPERVRRALHRAMQAPPKRFSSERLTAATGASDLIAQACIALRSMSCPT